MPDSPVDMPLPQRLNLLAIGKLCRTWPAQADAINVVLHKHQWVEPVGLSALACLVENARLDGTAVSVRHEECINAGYWERMGFFRALDLPAPTPAGSPRPSGGRFAEVRRIADVNDVDEITGELVAVLSTAGDAQSTLSHILSELMNNVCQHSGRHGFSAAQYIPTTDQIHLCIADAGCGLRSALQPLYDPADDAAAIDLALRVGVTSRPPQVGQRHMRNRGVGLSCAHRLVDANGGKFTVWSGNASFSAGVHHITGVPWTGTLIAAKMQRNRMTASFRDVMRQLTEELLAVERTKGR